MLCDNCKKREASVRYEENINGDKKEINLCTVCSKELGILSHNFMDNMLFSFFDEPLSIGYEKVKEEKCPKCGYTFSDYANTGFLGCDECYSTFTSKLEPVLHKLHGKSHHVKLKDNISTGKPKNKLEELQEQLKESIEKEEYEKAAVLRDKIKKIKERGEG